MLTLNNIQRFQALNSSSIFDRSRKDKSLLRKANDADKMDCETVAVFPSLRALSCCSRVAVCWTLARETRTARFDAIFAHESSQSRASC